MEERLSKEKILKKLRKGLLQQEVLFKSQLDYSSEVFLIPETDDALLLFAEYFHRQLGSFHYCAHRWHFVDKFIMLAAGRDWKQIVTLEEPLLQMFRHAGLELPHLPEEIKTAEAAITSCEALIARTGSLALNGTANLARTAFVFPPIHIAVAFRGQLHWDMKQYFAETGQEGTSSFQTFVTGPSRTLDATGRLILGGHGPKELHLFYIDEERPF